MENSKLFALLGLPDVSKQTQINNKMIETLSLIEYQYGKPVKEPEIVYDLKGRTAGQAWGGYKIRLNVDLINDPRHWEDMLHNTLPHELAHIACNQFWPNERVAHGYKWQNMMRRIGLEPTRCHQYETKPARKPKAKPHAYYCGCPEPHMMSDLIHTRIQTGQRSYRCNKCGERLR